MFKYIKTGKELNEYIEQKPDNEKRTYDVILNDQGIYTIGLDVYKNSIPNYRQRIGYITFSKDNIKEYAEPSEDLTSRTTYKYYYINEPITISYSIIHKANNNYEDNPGVADSYRIQGNKNLKFYLTWSTYRLKDKTIDSDGPIDISILKNPNNSNPYNNLTTLVSSVYADILISPQVISNIPNMVSKLIKRQPSGGKKSRKRRSNKRRQRTSKKH